MITKETLMDEKPIEQVISKLKGELTFLGFVSDRTAITLHRTDCDALIREVERLQKQLKCALATQTDDILTELTTEDTLRSELEAARAHIIEIDGIRLQQVKDGIAEAAALRRVGEEMAKSLRVLPLRVFGDDMAKCDAADFVDNAGLFFDAMVQARAALTAWSKLESK